MHKYSQPTAMLNPEAEMAARQAHFTHDLQMKIKVLLHEMDGELFVLKERKFDHKMWSMFAKIKNDMLDLLQQLNFNTVYLTAQKLIDYVKTKPTKDIIDNLQFLASHHLKTTSPDIRTSKSIHLPQIRSFSLLKHLAGTLETHLIEHTMSQTKTPSSAEREKFPLAVIKPDTGVASSKGEEATVSSQPLSADKTNPGTPKAKKVM